MSVKKEFYGAVHQKGHSTGGIMIANFHDSPPIMLSINMKMPLEWIKVLMEYTKMLCPCHTYPQK